MDVTVHSTFSIGAGVVRNVEGETIAMIAEKFLSTDPAVGETLALLTGIGLALS